MMVKVVYRRIYNHGDEKPDDIENNDDDIENNA